MTYRSPSSQFPQPLDRAALLLMVVLSALIGLLLLTGDHAAPRVREFSWQDKQIGAEDIAFILTFSQPMEHASVEDNLRIEPSLPGKVSWAGRRMAYTLDEPAPYGTDFSVALENAVDTVGSRVGQSVMEPFSATFRTRDRAFAYLSLDGDHDGQLKVQNLSQQSETVLTPENLTVLDFKPYPLGDRILFSALDASTPTQGVGSPKLYTVSTGIQPDSPAALPGRGQSGTVLKPTSDPPGVITEVLDNQTYQNLKFDLSPDGQVIVVQRVNRDDPTDFGLWIIRDNEPPEKMPIEPSGDFVITPDSQAIAVLQGEGTAILPLSEDAKDQAETEPLDFLPQFGRVLSFANDGTAAAMVKFNTDYTESLFLVTSFGEERELLRTVEGGSVLNAQFDARKKILYTLVTKATLAPAPEDAVEDERTLFPGEVFVEQPYLVAIVLDTGDQVDLLQLPVQPDLRMSLSPDNLGILFDQVKAEAEPSDSDANPGLVGPDGKAIASGQLWFLPLAQDDDGIPVPTPPEALPLSGLRPNWLP